MVVQLLNSALLLNPELDGWQIRQNAAHVRDKQRTQALR
jgi:hypothetical protein